jgi:hypothetical protein
VKALSPGDAGCTDTNRTNVSAVLGSASGCSQPLRKISEAAASASVLAVNMAATF